MNRHLIAALAAAYVAMCALPAQAADVVDEWASVKAPAAPEVKPVTLDPKTTALLVIDMTKLICSAERYAHCPPMIPAVKKLIGEARAKGVMVVFTSTRIPNVPKSEIWPELAPAADDSFFQGLLDKFLGTDLEKTLKEKGIQTVITLGVAAQGGVLSTGSTAAQRGFKVVVPVDAVAANESYSEQYTLWHLSHAPFLALHTTLTKMDMIKF
jgi:nicotinamidase-related amidase